MPPYPAKAVVNYFIGKAHEAGKPVTPMGLLKLVYFAHGWNLAITGSPLIDESVQAWRFGPVIPSLYHELKRYGSGQVTSELRDLKFDRATHKLSAVRPEVPMADVQTRDLLSAVWEAYSGLSAYEMSQRTHERGSPWSQVYREFNGDTVHDIAIPNELIRTHFEELARS